MSLPSTLKLLAQTTSVIAEWEQAPNNDLYPITYELYFGLSSDEEKQLFGQFSEASQVLIPSLQPGT